MDQDVAETVIVEIAGVSFGIAIQSSEDSYCTIWVGINASGISLKSMSLLPFSQ